MLSPCFIPESVFYTQSVMLVVWWPYHDFPKLAAPHGWQAVLGIILKLRAC